MTDTARFADIVLPATSQFEVDDIVKPSGHRHVHYNKAAMAPLGEARGNWDVLRQIAKAMGYTESWFDQTNEEVAREVFDATKRTNRYLAGIEFDDLVDKGWLPYNDPIGESHLQLARSEFRYPVRQDRALLRSHDPTRRRSACRPMSSLMK